MAKIIKLNHSQETLVSDECYEDLIQFKWHAQWRPNYKPTYYARRSILNPDGTTSAEYMHRRIASALPGETVDHISGDTLDNRIENIRIVTIRENCQNKHCTYSSMYPGVFINTGRGKKWRSAIRVNGKRIGLGFHDSEIEAFNAYVESCIGFGFPVELMVEKFNPYGQEKENSPTHQR